MRQDHSSLSGEIYSIQKDIRFGEYGKGAWIYTAWPFGPLPVVIILAWGAIEALQPPGYLGLFFFSSIGTVGSLWICIAGILMNVEGVRAIQRARIHETTVVLKPYFGKEHTVRRDASVEIEPFSVSKRRLWASIGTTFMAVDQPNWRIIVDGKTLFLMNGEYFDPRNIFFTES